nr:MAG TPA: hypothetical protein [Bacteriophage sp.]
MDNQQLRLEQSKVQRLSRKGVDLILSRSGTHPIRMMI